MILWISYHHPGVLTCYLQAPFKINMTNGEENKISRSKNMLFIFHLTDGLLRPQPKLKKSLPSHNPLQLMLTGFSDYRTLSKLSLPKCHLKHVNKELHTCFQTLDSFTKDFLVKSYWKSKERLHQNLLDVENNKMLQEIADKVFCTNSNRCHKN